MGKNREEIRMRATEAKDCGGEGVRVSSPTPKKGESPGSWGGVDGGKLGGLLAVRTKGLAPQSEGRGSEGKKRRWDSPSSREVFLYGGDENNKRRGREKGDDEKDKAIKTESNRKEKGK